MTRANESPTILVTGAGGFLGRPLVARMLDDGWRVVAVFRDETKAADTPWRDHPSVRRVIADLAAPSPSPELTAALGQADCVIHAAGRLAGNDADHAAGTVEPTRRLFDALALAHTNRRPDNTRPGAPDIVLVSSFSVYGYAALPEGATLDELTPLETDLHRRDAYARAKHAQERLAVKAAQRDSLRVRIVRPGAIVSNDRPWTARLGISKGGLTMLYGRKNRLPLIDVHDCAAAIAAAARAPILRNDVLCEAPGAFDVINLVGNDCPRADDYMARLDADGAGPGRRIWLPWRGLSAAAKLADLAISVAPFLSRMTPRPLQWPALAALAKPLSYSNARMKDRLFPDAPPRLQPDHSLNAAPIAADLTELL